MNLDAFIQPGLPISLALIMFSLGLNIRFRVFVQQLSRPRALMAGSFAQLCLVPCLALVIVVLLNLPPAVEAGLMILAFCPGGVTSNWFSLIARGNVPLSIGLTVLASLVTPFTIPILSEWALQWLLNESRAVHVPLGQTLLRLVLISVIPVVLGMALCTRFDRLAGRAQPVVYRFATGLFLCVIAAMVWQMAWNMPDRLLTCALLSLAVILCMMIMGHWVARGAGLDFRDRRTLVIEVGMQNGGMALVVTQTVLQSAELSVFPVVYGLVMLVPIVLYSRHAQRRET